MASDGTLLEKLETYRVSSGDPVEWVEFRQEVLDVSPRWEVFESSGALPQGSARYLTQIAPGHTQKAMEAIQQSPEILEACMSVMGIKSSDEAVVHAQRYTLTLIVDLLREDSSCFFCFDVVFRRQKLSVLGLQQLLRHSDWYIADKAAWLLTVLIGHAEQFFAQKIVEEVCAELFDSNSRRTELGTLEAITNLLKSVRYRRLVWSQTGLAERLFQGAGGEKQLPQILYRRVFAIWLLSLDKTICASLRQYGVAVELKLIMATSRVEKVIRLSLVALMNMMADKSLCEDIVEESLLDVVQQLEYEKWRDPDLYKSIRECASAISDKVSDFSSFDRYERELRSGSLSWGFIHSSRFWADNVNKFDANNCQVLDILAEILMDSGRDPITIAVACHDVGEFVCHHPLGRRKIAKTNIKERVMELMASLDPSFREVRREALLCCQKIMLNNWQDIQLSNGAAGNKLK